MLFTGIFLRIWQWPSQILLDDEWHALNFVFDRSLFDVFLQQGLGANSIPVNVYTWLLLHTVGWSEPLLRLPSLVAGISALIIIPLLVKRVWGGPVACITVALLAVSPVIIFYSRIMRPYAPAMLLATTSVLLTLIWVKEGKRMILVVSALSGAAAIYFHLYTAIPVGVPMLVSLLASAKPFAKRLGLVLASKKPFTDLLIAGGLFAVIDGLLVVVPNVLNPWWSQVQGIGHANLDTALTVVSLVSGTRNPVLIACVVLLLLYGFVAMIRMARTVGVAVFMTFFVFCLVMATNTQDGTHAGIQVARYGITFFPLSFMVIAVALVRMADHFRQHYPFFQRSYVPVSLALAAWSPYLATSPLWTTYSLPNNFTSHSAYQYRYEPIKWEVRSPERDLMPGISMEYAHIPQFYLHSPLLSSAKGIIEYPVLIGDQLNLYYYYQHFHRLPVVAGFTANTMAEPITPGSDFVFGDWSFDTVMSAMPETFRKKMSWKNMVDMNDTEALRNRFKGWVIVVHRDPRGEISHAEPENFPTSLELFALLTATFGDPAMSDEQLAVWLIN